MKIVFRADSGIHIGSGHIKRCLVLARQLKQAGNQVYFISKKHNQFLSEEISSEFLLLTIEKDYSDDQINVTYESWIGNLTNDLIQTNEYLSQIGDVDLVVIDHYSIGYEYESKLLTKKICVIDDIHQQKHFCHFLINVNPGSRPMDYLITTDNQLTRFLLGLNFSFIDKSLIQQDRVGKKILIYFGANDSDHNTLKFVQYLVKKKSNFEFIVVLDKKHPTYTEIEKLINENSNFELHGINNYFSQLLVQTYLFIGAGGSTTWERAFIGIPSIVVCVAENQVENCEIAESFEIAKYVGFSNDIDRVKLEEVYNFIQNDGATINRMRNSCYGLLDNQGCFRISQIFEQPTQMNELQFRLATIKDAEFLFNIRNDELTRKNSFHSSVISFEEHLLWFENSLKTRNRQIFIVANARQEIGSIRIDYNKSDAYLSWNLDPKLRGQGLGKKMLYEYIYKFPRKYKAKIKNENFTSIRIAEHAGFQILERNTDHLVLETMIGSSLGN